MAVPVDDKRFLETLLSSIADGVFTVNAGMRITAFNRAAERTTRVAAHQAFGQYCSEVFRAAVCGRGYGMSSRRQEPNERQYRLLHGGPAHRRHLPA